MSPREKASPRSRRRRERRRRLGEGVAKKEDVAWMKAGAVEEHDEGKAHNIRNVCRVR